MHPVVLHIVQSSTIDLSDKGVYYHQPTFRILTVYDFSAFLLCIDVEYDGLSCND